MEIKDNGLVVRAELNKSFLELWFRKDDVPEKVHELALARQ